MKIGFDAKRYFHNRTGLGNYSRDLVNGLCTFCPEHQYFLFDKHPDLKHVPSQAIAVTPQKPSLTWRSHGIIREMKLYGINVYHGLSNELPFGKFPGSIKKVVTIHDVIFRTFPEHYAMLDRSIYHLKTQHAVKAADAIVATSEATADELMHFYKADARKIQVVYQTCGDLHKAIYPISTIDTFRAAHRLEQPYLLYVSSFQARKNHVALITAFAALKQTKVKLVLAGRKGETYKTCMDLIRSSGMENMVNIVDDITAEELPLLYRGAQGFIYPSLTEGFGIPLIEAAWAGLPMAVNDIAVFREIAPQGTLYFDANNTENIKASLLQLMEKGEGKMNYEHHLKNFDTETISKKMIKIYG